MFKGKKEMYGNWYKLTACFICGVALIWLLCACQSADLKEGSVVPDPSPSNTQMVKPSDPAEDTGDSQAGTEDSAVEPQRPGTLTDSDSLPKEDTSDIQEMVTVSFQEFWAAEQYEMKTDHKKSERPCAFVYIYDPLRKTGRLAVFRGLPEDGSIYELTVYEPEWKGGLGLCAATDEPFDAKIVDRVNITYQERRYMDAAVCLCSDCAEQKDILDICGNTDRFAGEEMQFYFGELRSDTGDDENHWCPLGGNLKLHLKAGTREGAGEKFLGSLSIFLRIVERFDLHQALGIT